MPPVRAALLSVKGVKSAEVTLEQHQAVVTYDANQASVDDLIQAVSRAEGPMKFSARLKDSP